MPYIEMHSVSVSFPVYNAKGRSLKGVIASSLVGGGVTRESGVLSVHALEGVSLNVRSGDRVALLGHNGSGKSTLLRVMAGIYEPTEGEIRSQGDITAMFDPNLGVSMDASGWENIETRGILMGLRPDQIEGLKQDVFEFSGLGEFLDMPIRTYSAGMRMRLAFSVSTAAESEILLLDEAILTGDAEFMRLARNRLEEHIERANLLVLASHSLHVLKAFCNKGVLLSKGRAEAFDSVEQLIHAYQGERLVK